MCIGNIIVSSIDKYNINWIFIVCIFALTIVGSIFNGVIDLFSLVLGRYKIIYVILSILGTILIISICKKLDNRNLSKLKYFGVNSLIIMITHKSIINIIAYFIEIYTDYIYGTIMFIVVVLIEIPIVYVVNKYLSFTIGKFKNKSNIKLEQLK